jgi:hypothetical protein
MELLFLQTNMETGGKKEKRLGMSKYIKTTINHNGCSNNCACVPVVVLCNWEELPSFGWCNCTEHMCPVAQNYQMCPTAQATCTILICHPNAKQPTKRMAACGYSDFFPSVKKGHTPMHAWERPGLSSPTPLVNKCWSWLVWYHNNSITGNLEWEKIVPGGSRFLYKKSRHTRLFMSLECVACSAPVILQSQILRSWKFYSGSCKYWHDPSLRHNTQKFIS